MKTQSITSHGSCFDMAVTIEKDRFSKCYTVIHNEKVYFYINEKFDRIEHQLTEKDKKELKRWSYAHIEKWDYLPTGKLTLGIESWNYYFCF